MNEQVKKNIMEYKQKYLQKLADAQVPEKLEKQLEEMDWTCLELIHQKKQQRGTFAPLQCIAPIKYFLDAAAGDRTFRNPKEGRSVSGNGTESTPGRKSRCNSSGGRAGYPAGI